MDILRAAHEIDGYTLETGLSDASIERVVDSEMAGDLTMHIPKKKKKSTKHNGVGGFGPPPDAPLGCHISPPLSLLLLC